MVLVYAAMQGTGRVGAMILKYLEELVKNFGALAVGVRLHNRCSSATSDACEHLSQDELEIT